MSHHHWLCTHMNKLHKANVMKFSFFYVKYLFSGVSESAFIYSVKIGLIVIAELYLTGFESWQRCVSIMLMTVISILKTVDCAFTIIFVHRTFGHHLMTAFLNIPVYGFPRLSSLSTLVLKRDENRLSMESVNALFHPFNVLTYLQHALLCNMPQRWTFFRYYRFNSGNITHFISFAAHYSPSLYLICVHINSAS